MKWLNVEHRFDDRAGVLTLPYKTVMARRLVDDLRGQDDPSKLEAILRVIVLAARPELAGCVIWSMGFDMMTQCFEIGVSHELLPRLDIGCYPSKMPLFEEKQDGTL